MSIGNKRYIGTGGDSSSVTWIQSYFWEFDPAGSGVKEIDLSGLTTVYPNPSDGKVNVLISGVENMQMNSIVVCNIHGERIYQLTNQHISTPARSAGGSANLQVDLSFQPSGVYFLHIRTK